jgi:hypothetical protein
VDPRAGLDDVEKRKVLTPPGLDFRPLGRPRRLPIIIIIIITCIYIITQAEVQMGERDHLKS